MRLVPDGKELRSRRQFVVPFGFGNPVLADLVQQGFVADLENRGRLFAVPVGLLQCLGDGLRFGFIFGGASQRFQAAGLRSASGGIAGALPPVPSLRGSSSLTARFSSPRIR